MSKRTWIIFVAVGLAGLLLAACDSGIPDVTPIPSLAPREATPVLADALLTLPAPGDEGGTSGAAGAVSLDEAAAIFADNCAGCHGDMGTEGGVGPVLNPSDEVAAMSKADVQSLLLGGRGAMPGFEGRLDAAQVNGLVNLLHSWQGMAPELTEVPEPTEAVETPELTEAPEPTEAPTEATSTGGIDGAAVFEANCQACHGEGGTNAIVGPDLAMNPDIAAMDADEVHDILVNGIDGSAMQGFGDRLSGEEIDALVDLLYRWQEGSGEAAPDAEPVSLDDAAGVFATNCQACHGENGEEGGIGPALNPNEAIAGMSDEAVKDVLLNGVDGTAMGSYEGVLSDAEIDSLVALVRSWQDGE